MRDNTHAPMEMKHITPDVLMRLSIAFTSGSKFSQSLEKALELIGKISNHDRIYIIEVHHNMTYTITYNWHEKSLKSHSRRIQAQQPDIRPGTCTTTLYTKSGNYSGIGCVG